MGHPYLELEDLTLEQYTFFVTNIYNGVGSDQLHVKGPEFIFRNPAKRHDFSGFGGGTDSDRIQGDARFLADCLIEIAKRKPYKKYIYTPIAYLYFGLLKTFSKLAWDYYDERPKTWDEFLHRVELVFNREKKPTPWVKRATRFLLLKNVRNQERVLKALRVGI